MLCVDLDVGVGQVLDSGCILSHGIELTRAEQRLEKLTIDAEGLCLRLESRYLGFLKRDFDLVALTLLAKSSIRKGVEGARDGCCD